MRNRLVLLVLAAALAVLGACGKEIGDACVIPADCSPNGDRICIDATATTDGYCTIQGCDFSTCPDESVCVRFFTGSFANKPCDPLDPDAANTGGVPVPPNVVCSLDELCALEGHCVPRSSEIRYCMRTCGSDGDCRDGYECRDLDKMKQHGGQPVLESGGAVDDSAPKFCAKSPG
jgi:hypothetical protein